MNIVANCRNNENETMNNLTIYKDGFCISTHKAKLDLEAVHQFLSTQSYWSLHIPFEKVAKAAANSLCFGLYFNEQQIGYARIISDYSTFAYLADVYVLPEFRGRNLSKWLMQPSWHIQNYKASGDGCC